MPHSLYDATDLPGSIKEHSQNDEPVTVKVRFLGNMRMVISPFMWFTGEERTLPKKQADELLAMTIRGGGCCSLPPVVQPLFEIVKE